MLGIKPAHENSFCWANSCPPLHTRNMKDPLSLIWGFGRRMDAGDGNTVIPSCQQQSEILQQECDHTAGRATPLPSISPFQSSNYKCCTENLISKQYPHPKVVSSPLWNVPQKLQAHADHVIKIRFHQLKGLTSTKNKGFNSKHMREIKYAEEKWILHRDAEPHRVNFKSIFSLSGTLVFKKRRRTTNRISNLFTYKSATRPSVTQKPF